MTEKDERNFIRVIIFVIVIGLGSLLTSALCSAEKQLTDQRPLYEAAKSAKEHCEMGIPRYEHCVITATLDKDNVLDPIR